MGTRSRDEKGSDRVELATPIHELFTSFDLGCTTGPTAVRHQEIGGQTSAGTPTVAMRPFTTQGCGD